MFRLPSISTGCSFAIGTLVALAGASAFAQSNNNLRLMPLGDSITAGYLSSTGNGYRGPLSSALSSQVLYLDLVGSQHDGSMPDPDNEGHYGDRIDQIASLINADLSTYKPNLITLMIGINDLNGGYEVSTAPDRLASLIDQIETAEPDATLLVAQLIVNANATTESRVQTYNAAIPGIVSTRANAGKHIYMVDMSAVTTSDLADGLHPNDTGYQLIANAWDAAIETVIGDGWIKDPISGSATRPTGSIYSGLAGKCLDNYGGTSTQGAKADVYDCNGSTSGQQWNINNGTIMIENLCLDVAGAGTANGTLVDLWDCNGAANQTWTVNANGTIENPVSGRCLDDPNSNLTNGTQLEIYDCNGGANQQWQAPAYGPITSSISGKCLDDFGGHGANDDKADSYACNSAASQQWAIYNHTVKLDGRCLNVVGASTSNDALVDIETCSGSTGQAWTPVSGTLVNSASGKCLDNPNSNTTNGTQLQIYTCNSGNNQKWAIPNL